MSFAALRDGIRVMDSLRSVTRLPAVRLSLTPLGHRLLKYVALALFLINVRSWPLMWHFRVFYPVLKLRLRWHLCRLSLIFKPKHIRRKVESEWLSNLCPIGADPLRLVHTWKSWASPDDSDYNMHLSNSSYAKSFDCVRLETALRCFPTFFRTGGWIALGATHYNFLREIPIFASYEVRLSIAGWDNKWLYIIARYVTQPSKKSKHGKVAKTVASSETTPKANGNGHTGGAPYPDLHTPADPLDAEPKSDPPTPVSARANGTAAVKATEVSSALRQTSRVHLEPDGATLHCMIVNALCFKSGRITVPPALVLGLEGFAAPPSEPRAPPYSARNPPPSWAIARALAGDEPADMRRLMAFYAGGWRAAPEGERWWEAALAPLEERRRAGVQVVGALRRGMEGAQTL